MIRKTRTVGGMPAREAAAALGLCTALAVAHAEATDRHPGDREGGEGSAARFAAHETLPEGGPEALAALYHAAYEVPGIESLGDEHRRNLLDVVTQRYKDRLADRGTGSPKTMRAHLARLSGSALAADRPMVMAQSCAQYGIEDGVCADHRGYVRRARLLEEMLATGRITLPGLETELVGAPRRSLKATNGN